MGFDAAEFRAELGRRDFRQSKFADLIKVSRPMVTFYRQGLVPKPPVVKRIVEVLGPEAAARIFPVTPKVCRTEV